ncbi:MAG: flavin reductase family protein [Methylococcales bacterium]
MTIDVDSFKKALQDWASGVTVVTTKTDRFGCQGMTATAFSSVSVDPPLILVCLNKSADTAEGIKESQCFAVNILNSDQQEISNSFAGGSTQEERFKSVTWSESTTGAPILDSSLASLDCRVVDQVFAGTHWIIIGEVQDVICRSGEPLLYYQGGYQTLLKP